MTETNNQSAAGRGSCLKCLGYTSNEPILHGGYYCKCPSPFSKNDDSQQKQGELKPCPFCGGEAEFEELNIGAFIDEKKVSFSAGCITEHCFGYQSLASFARKSDAAKAWNTRAESNRQSELEKLNQELAYGIYTIQRLAQIDPKSPSQKGNRMIFGADADEIRKLSADLLQRHANLKKEA